MDEESSGLHIIFICILACILFFTYFAIPSDPTVQESSKVSAKARKKVRQPIVEPEKTLIISKTTQQSEALKTDLNPEKKVSTPKNDTALADEKNKQQGNISNIPMNNPKYKTHKKGIVIFTHQKHVDDYKISCGQCHHDKNGTPLNLTYEDSVQNCIECHPGTLKPKGEKLDKKQKIAKYHFEAIHANCIGCHKTYNIEKGDPKGKGPAPISCTKCHPKK